MPQTQSSLLFGLLQLISDDTTGLGPTPGGPLTFHHARTQTRKHVSVAMSPASWLITHSKP